ncbi:MAG: leucine-rich repeat protein [Ruminococcus sp.]|nr:leucine-rich repeat protein [Ruminococcus sp.]
MKKSNFYKVLSYVIALAMLLTAVPVMPVLAYGERLTDTYRYYFYQPESWAETAEKVGIYWWEGSNTCSNWPGYEMNKGDAEGVYYYDVPVDVPTFVVNNYYSTSTGDYTNAYSSKNVMCEYYFDWENPLYPNGTENFDNMIYVFDLSLTETNEYSGASSFVGEWFYYYGNGEYGTAKERTDSTAVFNTKTYDAALVAPNGEKVPDNGALWGMDYTVENDEVTITGYDGFISDVVISDTIDGYPVTRIADGAFSNSTNLKSVTIPKTVNNIGTEAFKYCWSLSEINVSESNSNYCSVDGVLFTEDLSVLLVYPSNKTDTEYTIPDTVKRLENFSFEKCDNIHNIILPDGLEEIGQEAFGGCYRIEKMHIPASVKTIAPNAFAGCYDITEYTVDNNNENYAELNGALYSKDFTVLYNYPAGSTNTCYEISENTVTIAGEAFDGSCNLEDIVLPEGLKVIGDYAFYGCEGLTEVLLPDNVSDIGVGAFSMCQSLESITLPKDLVTLSSEVFMDCFSLKSVIIPEGVSIIDEYTFASCENLESVTFLGVVEAIDRFAFLYAESLKDVYYAGTQEQWSELDLDDYSYYLTRANIHYETTTPHYELDSIVSEPDCDEDGECVYTCPCGYTKTVTAEKLGHDYVNGVCSRCESQEVIESEHNYAEDCDITWTIFRENAKKISITFSEDTETESNYDFIVIYDANDEEVGEYSGTELAGETITVEGNTVKIRLISDTSVSYYGFKVTDIIAHYEDDTTASTSTEATTVIASASTSEPEETTVFTEPTETTANTTVSTEPTETTENTMVSTEPTEVPSKNTETTTEPEATTIPTEASTNATDPTETTNTPVTVFPTTEATIPAETTGVAVTTEASEPTETTAETDTAQTTGEGVVTTVTSPTTENSEPIVDKGDLGDVNNDGKVNIKDATLIQKFAAKLQKFDEGESLRADVNTDGKVNVKDATAIQKYAAKIETGLPIGKPII